MWTVCRRFVRFQVLKAAIVKMATFWHIAPCSLEVYRRLYVFYGIRWFTKIRYWSRSWARWIHTHLHTLFHFNNIIPSTLTCFVNLTCNLFSKFKLCILLTECIYGSRVVAGFKNSPTVTNACRKRRLKWVPSAWRYSWATLSPGS
jgi:hypothetical protein